MQKLVLFMVAIAIIIVGVFGFMLLKATKPQAEPLAVEETAWVVKTQVIDIVNLAPTLTLYGKIESPSITNLRTPNLSVNAIQIKDLAVLEGQQVKAGQSLIRLDDNDIRLVLQQRQADVAEIQAQIKVEQQNHASDVKLISSERNLLNLIEKNVERANKLQQQNLAARATLDEAQQALERQKLALQNRQSSVDNHKFRLNQLEARLKRAIAAVNLTQLELERLNILAPFDGVITEVFVAVADRVRAHDVLLKLYNINQLELRAQIPARYQHIIATNLATKLSAQAHKVTFELNRLSGQTNASSGGVDALFTIIRGKEYLTLGEFVIVRLKLPLEQEVIALPFEAIYDGNRVYKLNQQRMVSVQIERIGEMVSDHGEAMILLRSPELNSGDEVIITQLPNAMDGLKVNSI